MKKPSVGVIMGSQSDLPIMQGALDILKKFSIPYECKVISAHRTPLKMVDYASQCHKRGLQIVIAGAGGAAHLPGMVASLTHLPVIGVPVRLQTLDGLDSLLSIVQMPKGIPVATVAINNSANAGILASRILALSDEGLQKKLIDYSKELELKVEQMNSSSEFCNFD